MVIAAQRVISTCEGDFKFRDHMDFYKSVLESDLALQSLKLGLVKINSDALYELDSFTMEGPISSWRILETEFFTIRAGYRASGWEGSCNEPLFNYVDEKFHSADELSDLICLEPTSCDMFYGVLSECSLVVGHYDVDYPGEDSAASTCSLAFKRNEPMHKNDFCMVNAGEEVLDSNFTGTLVYLIVHNKPRIRILPRFSLRDKRFIGWSSGDTDASRLELIARTLVELRYTPGVETLEELSRHQDHYVRWNSMRALLRLDETTGINRIRFAASEDPDLEVRHAAHQTLAMIDQANSGE